MMHKSRRHVASDKRLKKAADKAFMRDVEHKALRCHGCKRFIPRNSKGKLCPACSKRR